MRSVTCIINSTIFSVLGKSGANPQSGGYYKFNKQFLMPIPFPIERINENSEPVSILARLYSEISNLQERYFSSTSNTKKVIAGQLNKKWLDLDEICFNLYGVTKSEKDQIKNVGRTISRIDLLDGVE